MHNLRDMTEVKMDYEDYAIGGKMFIASVRIPEYVFASQFGSEEARKKMRQALVEEIASEIINKQLCEITQMTEPDTLFTRVAARCYVAPDATVKLLRKLK